MMSTEEDIDVLRMASEIAKPFEGLHKLVKDKVYAYHDPVGYPTIGYGHLLNKNAWSDLSGFEVLSIEGCENLLASDMKHSAMRALALSPNLHDYKNLYRWAAITDFIFNCGDGNYSVSTLRKRVNSEDWEDASQQILKWDKAAGQKLAGLTKRRNAESLLLKKEM